MSQSNEALVVVVKDLRKNVEKLNKLRLDIPQKIKQRVSFQAEVWGTIIVHVYAKEHGEGKSLHHLENALSSVEAKTMGDDETKCVVENSNTMTLKGATEVEYTVTIDSKITSKKPSVILTNTFELVVVPTFLLSTSSQPLRPPDKLTYEPLLYVPTNSSQTDVQSILKSYYQQPSSSGKLVLPPPKVAAEYSVTTAPPPSLGMVASQAPVTETETNMQDEVVPTQPPKRPRDATTSNRAPLSKKQKQKHHSTSPPTSPNASSSLSEPVDATERNKLLEQFNSLVDATEPYRPEDTIELGLDDNVLI